MAETVIMPKLGFDMAEGTLVRWVIGEGQPVAKGAVLAEIETDKATVEVESNFAGIVAKHLVAEKDVVPVNTPIAIITQPGEALVKTPLEDAGGGGGKPEASHKEQGSRAVQTEAAQKQEISSQAAAPVKAGGPVKASPIARRLASEKGIDLSAINGSGPGGRVVRRDVESYQPPQAAPAAAPASTLAVTPPRAEPGLAPATAAQPGVERPLSKLRNAIARRMVEAKQQTPHFYITRDYDMAALMALRKQLNGLLPENEKISVNDFIVKAVAMTLKQFPNLNASFAGSQILQHAHINIGVAVAVENGLLTVVCRDADQQGLRQIAVEVKNMAGKAREGKVRPEDIEGSTFSISNLGMYEVEQFAAIINPPEAAILAVGAVQEVPVVRKASGESPAQLVIGTRMKATISVDHRVSDGAEAAQFLQALAGWLENPLKLVL